MTATHQNTLKAEGLTCIRGGRVLFSALSFSVDPSQALIITGANGSGKTSLLRVFAGLLSPQEGLVSWCGESASPSSLLNGELHYLGHAEALKPYMTVNENLKMWGGLYGDYIDVDSATRKTGIYQLQDYPVRFLSEGQKKRVNLARLLAIQKPIWLLDEPAAGLDKDGLKLLSTLIQDHLKTGGIVIAATHQDRGVKGAKSLKLGTRKRAAA